MKTFTDLADLAKEATGADRELDVLIGETINLIAYDDVGIRQTVKLNGLEETVRRADIQQVLWSTALPRYTASYDAIMTLAGDDIAGSSMAPMRTAPGGLTSTCRTRTVSASARRMRTANCWRCSRRC
jgi:hypothetical protein